MFNYETIKKSFYYNSIELLIDFINSVIVIHIFFISNSIFYLSFLNTEAAKFNFFLLSWRMKEYKLSINLNF